MKRKSGTLVKVEWLDQSWYHGPAAAEGAIQPIKGISIGFFLEEDKTWFCLAGEQFYNGEEISYRHILSIPKACILKVTKI